MPEVEWIVGVFLLGALVRPLLDWLLGVLGAEQCFLCHDREFEPCLFEAKEVRASICQACAEHLVKHHNAGGE